MELLNTILQNQVGLVVAISIIAISIFLYWVGVQPFSFFQKNGIPHPDYKLFVGNFPQLMRNGGNVKFSQECLKKLGTIFGIYLGRQPMVFVADPKLLEMLFVKEFSNFHNRQLMGSPKPPMQLTLVFADYVDWRRVRPTVSPTFSSGKMKQTIPLVIQCVDTLASILSKCAKSEETVDIFTFYGRMTMEVILSVAFGVQTDFQVKGNKKIAEVAAEFFRRKPSFVFIEMLPLPRIIKRFLKGLSAADPTFLLNILKPVVEERKRNPSSRKDFLQLLLSENKADGTPKLTDDEIYATAITFLLAGYETTSTALAYTTYLLALHPEIQERLYEEIKDGADDAGMYDYVQKLEYLDAVFNESLRMYPPGWQTSRIAEKDIMFGKYKIPAGTAVVVPIFAIHHFEDFWKDHNRFDPERFSPERKGEINPLTFLPFGYGPRNCIGMRFALTEAKITLVKLLRKFRFVKTAETEPHPLQLHYGLTISPVNGVKVKVVERVPVFDYSERNFLAFDSTTATILKFSYCSFC